MNTGCNYSVGPVFMRYKRTDLKWYQKFWNIITGHKNRNYEYVEVKSTRL